MKIGMKADKVGESLRKYRMCCKERPEMRNFIVEKGACDG